MDFSVIISGDKPVLVDFYADWCGPCKVMAPVLKEFKQRHADRLTILKVDVDRNQAVAAKYQISGIPTLILFRKGKILWRKSGALPIHVLEAELKNHIA